MNTNPDTMYKYFAFISFQNTDAREAVRLQHAIERYRLPAVLCRHNRSIPRRIKPLFCYLNDMHAGEELMMDLKQRMEQSRYLIVLCSPRSVASKYVNSGIDYFVSLGRRDSIIPLVVDGVPYSGNPETECFPEALRRHFPKHPDPLQDHSILGVNIHEAGISRRTSYNRAMLMVVARMLQLDFDGLLLRDRQRRRRRTLWLALFIAAVCTALTLTWRAAQPISVETQLYEATPANRAIPPLQDIVCTLHLNDETKTDTAPCPDSTLLFANIPQRYLGREVHVEITGTNCLPLDTLVVLQRRINLPIRRDASIYGHIHFRLRGFEHPERIPVHIAGRTVIPEADGLVELSLLIGEQRMAYAVEAQGRMDSIIMPCGKDDILCLQ